MGTAFAFGLGVIVGALCAFNAGRKFQDARRASALAAEYFGVARTRWGGAAGSLVVFALVVGVGVTIMIVSR